MNQPTISSATSVSIALSDIADGFSRRRLWSTFAWEDIKSTYKRSVFGALWVSLSFGVFVLVKLLIFMPLVGGDDLRYFTMYLVLGFFVWQFLSQVIISAPTIFCAAENWIKNDPIPLPLFAFQATTRALINMAFCLVTVIAFWIYFRLPLTWNSLLAFPALFLFALNAVWVNLLLGIVCTKSRDLTHLVHTIMRFAFFLTPIFWTPEQIGSAMQILWWNPFAHFIWIFRSPLLDNDPALVSWIFVGCVTVVGWVSAIVMYALFRKRLVFWL
jgi:ABC-type polysaccharide/polyol phosphate export permease